MARSVSKPMALDRLGACVREMSGLEEAGCESPQFLRWRKDAAAAVRHIFADDPKRVEQFEWKLGVIHLPKLGSSTPPAEVFSQGLAEIRATLESMISEVEGFWPEEARPDASDDAPEPILTLDRKRVFIVHGRDDGMKNTVARFLEKLDLTPVILHEMPDEGRTVFQKLLQESETVAYAVVLLTPDDEGQLRQDAERLMPRARQNVVFELGYLLGKLGSTRVKALYAEGADLELPSDYLGVIYLPMDADGGWKLVLCRELREAGIELDANRAL